VGSLRHQGESTVTIDKPFDDVFAAVVHTGAEVGTIREQSKLTGYVVVRTPMKLLPPQNPATVRVSVKKAGNTQTEVSFQSDSFDSVIGFGSAGKATDCSRLAWLYLNIRNRERALDIAEKELSRDWDNPYCQNLVERLRVQHRSPPTGVAACHQAES